MKKERLYYVDWLRVLVILTLIPYHSALTYTGLGDVYIKSSLTDIKVLPFLIVQAPLDNFFMPLLFFLSGIGTYYALHYRSKREYTKERTKKLLVPLIFGTIFLCPIQAYFKGLYYGFSGNYLSFIPEFFSSKINYYMGYAHLWFLLYLFIISLACMPLFYNWINERSRLEKITSYLCKGNNIFLPIAFIVLIETLLRPFFNGPQSIIMDWTNDIIYSSVFIFGFVFASSPIIQERLDGLANISKFIVITLIPVFILIYYPWAVYHSKAAILVILWAFMKGVYECSAIIMLMGIGKKYLNKGSNLLTYLNKASFTYYFIHFLPVSALTYYFVRTNLNVYVKYLFVILLSYMFIFIVYDLVVRRLLGSLRRKVPIQPNRQDTEL